MKKASLFTYRASLTLVQLTAETLLYQQMQAIFQSIQTDGINHLIDEGKPRAWRCRVAAYRTEHFRQAAPP